VWLTVAWLSPLPLLVAGMLVATVYVVRRRRGDHLGPRPDDELDVW
jgi:cytochrome c-type biogenesis protein CcmH/NrfF